MTDIPKKRIVITGLGVISSIGIGKESFWKNLINGKSGISRVDAFDTSKHFSNYGGEIKNFKIDDFIDREKASYMGRASHLAIAATKLALKDSKLLPENLARSRIGVCIGTTMGEPQVLEQINRTWIKDGIDKVDAHLIFQYPANAISSNVAITFNLTAHNRMFTTACAAGNYAIGYGYSLIQLGKVDMMFAGGSDAFSYVAFTGFNQFSLLAPEKCQPFDKNRKGMLVGEGSGVVILETLEGALKRNAPIYAEILGYGLSCDAFHMTNPHVEGITDCMLKALKESNISPQEVDYLNAHGTGTVNNDKTECAAIKNVFGTRRMPVSSIKSMLGHTMGAASAIEAVACCLTLKNDIIPPTINYETPDPECDIDCVPNVAREQRVDVVLNNGFAFGGNNACLVLKKFKERF